MLVAVIAAILLLAACERPDPEDIVTEVQPAPTETPTIEPTPLPTPTPAPTNLPMQFFVVIVQPTPVPATASDTGASQTESSSVEEAPAAAEPTPGPRTEVPDDFYMGWAWSRGLVFDEIRVEADQFGLILRDRPSSDGLKIGLIVGLGDVLVIGQEQCGYVPVLVQINDLLNRTTPRPEVMLPQPTDQAATTLSPNLVTPPDTVAGYAYSDELTILGDTAITGEFGVNLRLEPCLYGKNLGLIPGGANVIVTGPPVGEYTPVLVDDDVLQTPFDPSVFELGRFFSTVPPPQATLASP